MAWTDELAAAVEVEPLSGGEVARILRLSREVAHRVERKDTPLTTFLLGFAVAGRIETGIAREDAFAQVLGTLEGLLPGRPLETG